MIISLVLCAGALAQGGDDPVSAEAPTVLGPSSGEEDVGEEEGVEATASDQDLDCSDFNTQDEAQRFFESRGGPDEDLHRLDEDPGEDDGRACENLPSDNGGGDVDDDETPAGSVDSGFGPVDPGPEAGARLSLTGAGAGIGLLIMLGLGLLRLRRAE